ncbi:thermosome subunit [Candidatus Woesearchaeota archaeon]|nr:thermosome subunit [Candidatus Woesearchaeota archaeon]
MVRTKDNSALHDGTQRVKGRDALSSNIEAARAVAELIRTTLGPMGMDKMLIDSYGTTTITNDGATILREMDVEHPGAQILVDIAKTQEREVGDGTTSVVLLAAELLYEAQQLMEKGFHQNSIVHSYKKALGKALQELDVYSSELQSQDKEALSELLKTTLSGKSSEFALDTLIPLLLSLLSERNGKKVLLRDHISLAKEVGKDCSESCVFEGISLNREPIHPQMPTKLEQAKVLLIDSALEAPEPEGDTKLSLETAQDFEEYLERERKYIEDMCTKLSELGVTFVVCQKGIDDRLAALFAQKGMLALRRVKRSDLEKLALCSSARIISDLHYLKKEDLGELSSLSFEKDSEFSQVKVLAPKGNVKTLLLRASSHFQLDELERAIDDALGTLQTILSCPKLLPGGGSVELHLHRVLLDFASSLPVREQLVIEAFARTLLTIPRSLCQNCGHEELEVMTKLVSEHQKNKNSYAGVHASKGWTQDLLAEGVLETYLMKKQAYLSAVECSVTLLRIDDIIAARKIEQREKFDLD